MNGIRGEDSSQALHVVGHARKILEIGLVHGFADPVTGGLRRDRPARVVQRLKKRCSDIVRAILISDNADDRPY